MKTTISKANQEKIKAEFFTMENSALNIDCYGVMPSNPVVILNTYPKAIIIKCVCTALNPLNILKVSNYRILQAIADVEIFNPGRQKFEPLKNIDKSFDHMRNKKYFVEFIKLLGKQRMIFVFNTYDKIDD